MQEFGQPPAEIIKELAPGRCTLLVPSLPRRYCGGQASSLAQMVCLYFLTWVQDSQAEVMQVGVLLGC